MVRISAFLIAACMVLIAGLLSTVVYARFGFTGAESALAGLGALTAFAVYYAVAARRHDRIETSNQLAKLARGAGDLASQLAEFGRRLNAVEDQVQSAVERAVAISHPLTEEVERLAGAVKSLSGSVSAHEAVLSEQARKREVEVEELPGIVSVERMANAPAGARLQFAPSASRPVPTNGKTASFPRPDRDAVSGALHRAIAAGEIELHLQPVVTLPQRKLRYYEALARLKTDGGELVAASEFLSDAEAAALTPKIDYLAAARSVQIVRRLLLQKREVGLFCNLSAATLADPGFSKFLELTDANRAIAAALVFEFPQSAVRAMGAIEHASLAALAERGFRFSMDNLTDLRVNAHELNDCGFRFVKVPAALLFNRLGAVAADIRPADFSEQLGRFGIDLIADRIENENTVIDLLDYDVRFGQGVLFSPPRPLRPGALEGTDVKGDEQNATNGAEAAPAVSFTPLARAGMGHN
jgi:cyclic-di-GMP phosphodiesterase TipF (flagellum assembly factor)